MVLWGAAQAKCARLDLIRQINFVFLYQVALLIALLIVQRYTSNCIEVTENKE